MDITAHGHWATNRLNVGLVQQDLPCLGGRELGNSRRQLPLLLEVVAVNFAAIGIRNGGERAGSTGKQVVLRRQQPMHGAYVPPWCHPEPKPQTPFASWSWLRLPAVAHPTT